MSKKDVLHIPIPEVPPPSRTAHSEEEERAPHVPPIFPAEGSDEMPDHHPHHEPRIIEPQPSSIPYPGVGVS
ncbi:hypothetical protein [Hyalangium rubrum]|uniref:Uncharacterized protein n=1 Tax=Hyalangium rubrum TaxID=3103134 RepID=A0ABU5GY36_9BACT|nr:hypothetical protein [Hyalangium sp. s54d21]MDY7226099.1 hypothetical protein [Hyalangium sp. s54d21]